MSQYAPPPVPDWAALKPASLPDNGAPTPPAFNPPSNPPSTPSSSPAWQGIRLPTTLSSSYHPFPPPNHHHHHHHPHAYSPYPKHIPHRPTPLNLHHNGDDELRRQQHILSPQPRYPSGSPSAGFQSQSSRLELDLLRQQPAHSNGGGFWSPQPGRGGGFTSPPGSAHQHTFHSPPPVPIASSTQGVTLPPKFMAKQSPSVTPMAAGLHPNHQKSQLSTVLGNGTHSSPGLLSIQTSLPTSLPLKQECRQSNSPTSTTANVQDPHTSSSDDPQKNGERSQSASSGRDKEEGCHSTAASPPHVSTTRISPGNHDNSSTSATDTPNSIIEDDKEAHQDCNNSEPRESGQTERGEPMDASDESHGLQQHHQEAANVKTEPSDPADQEAPSSRKNSDAERPQSSSSQLVMDVDGEQKHGTQLTPRSMPSTPTSQETASASALLSLSQQGMVPQPSENNLNAALRIEERIAEETMRRARGILQTMAASVSAATPPASTTMAFSTQATITRPPGLGPPTMAPSSAPLAASFPAAALGRIASGSGFPGQGGVAGPGTYQCPICGFSSTSKFHFNSHMNTHTDHQCTMCDYTARTEGRLKRHMEGHSEEEKRRAGVNHVGEPLKTAVGPRTSDSSNGSHDTPEPGPEEQGGPGGPEPSPLERLQMQLNETTPNSITASIASTPPSSEGTPRRSTSSSKPKSYRCKQCEHVSMSKEESWRHARIHIKPDKLLTCPQCEFVTEYKHHLEYHLRNHFGSKPFQCQKCHYSCVNKSMLNSHMKSHSQFYQFRCSDCTYATKYCHSLKLHLRKYGHRPATVITPDGQRFDPSQNLDLYGNRARNRQRQRESTSSPHFSSPSNSQQGDPNQQSMQGSPANSSMGGLGSPVSAPTMVTAFDPSLFHQQHQSAMASSIATLGARLPTIPTMLGAPLQMQIKQALIRQQELQAQAASSANGGGYKCHQCDFSTAAKEELDKHILTHLPTTNPAGLNLAHIYEAAMQARAALVGGAAIHSAVAPPSVETEGHSPPVSSSPAEVDGSAASSGSPISKGSGDEGSATGSGSHASDKAPGGSSRRKGKARKLDSIAQRLQECRSVEAPPAPDLEGAPKAPSAPVDARFDPAPSDINWSSAFVCRHCKVAFMNEVIYQLHMGFHGYDYPFRCNRCGHDSADAVGFFMHIAQSKH